MGISEAVSEKRRGRPPKFNYIEESDLLRLFPEVTTRRGKQNVLYRMRALRVLHNDYPWIANEQAMRNGEPHAWKPGILTALGRIPGESWMRRAAAFICRRKPRTTRQGEQMIRRWRTGMWFYFERLAATRGLGERGAR